VLHNPEYCSVNANCSENLKTNICLFHIQSDVNQRSVISPFFLMALKNFRQVSIDTLILGLYVKIVNVRKKNVSSVASKESSL